MRDGRRLPFERAPTRPGGSLAPGSLPPGKMQAYIPSVSVYGMSYHGSAGTGLGPSVSHRSAPALLLTGVLVLAMLLSPLSLLSSPVSTHSSGNSPTGPVANVFPTSGPAPKTVQTTLTGVDVSYWQGSVNWGSVASTGIKFAFTRASEGGDYTDPTFATNMQNGKAAGLYMGAYDFGCPVTNSNDGCTAISGSADASYFDSVAGPYFKSGYMYPALDLEVGCGTISTTAMSSWVAAWMNTVESYISTNDGFTIIPIVYMSSSYASGCVTSSTTAYHLWVADWGVSSPSTGYWSTWSYWQYTDAASVSGISGSVDGDYFNGGLSSLQSGYIFGSAPLTGSYAMQDVTTGTPLYCGGSFLTGDQIQFTGSASGGTAPYTYSWNFGDGTSGSGQVASHAYSSTGSVDPLLTISDSKGNSYPTGQNCAFTVNPGLSISSALSASPNPVVVTNTTTFSIGATGGTSPYSYAYSGLPPGCGSSNTASLTCTPSGIGTFSVVATVTDAQGRTATSSTSLTVQATPLVVSSFLAVPSSLMVNNSTTFSVTLTGGLAPYVFAYAGLPPGCASANAASLACTPTAIGSYTVSVTVSDSTGQTKQATTTLSVTPRPLVITSFLATPATLMIQNNTTFQVAITGGLGPYSYSYAGLPTGCVSNDSSTLPCAPLAAGLFNVTVTVNDSQGRSESATLTLTVQEGLTVASFTATPSLLKIGAKTTLVVDVSSGNSPYSYTYYQLPTGCASQNSAVLYCTPTAPGTYAIVVDVRDSAGRIGSSRADVQVVAPLTILSFRAVPDAITVGESTVLQVSLSGGAAPISYDYTGLPGGCLTHSVASLDCSPTSSGTFNVSVTIQDSLGEKQVSTILLHVAPAYLSSPSGSSAFLTPSTLLLVALGIAAVVCIAVLIRRRRQRPEAETPG